MKPLGFFVAVAMQYTLAVYLLLYVACFMSISVKSQMIGISALKDVKRILKSINKCSKTKKNQLKMRKHLIVYLRAHSTAKQLSMNRWRIELLWGCLKEWTINLSLKEFSERLDKSDWPFQTLHVVQD